MSKFDLTDVQPIVDLQILPLHFMVLKCKTYLLIHQDIIVLYGAIHAMSNSCPIYLCSICINATVFFPCWNGIESGTKIYHTVMRWLTPVSMFILSCMEQCMEVTDHAQNVMIRAIHYHHLRSDTSLHFSDNRITQWRYTISYSLEVNWI